MKKWFILSLKGMAYGITNLVPAIGGGLILIMMGIYEQFVEVVGNFFIRRDKWREYIPFLMAMGIGAVISTLAFAKIISAILVRYEAPTMFFFMGMLLGTIPGIVRMHRDMRFTAGRGVAALAGLALVVLLRAVQDSGLSLSTNANLSSLGGMTYNIFTSLLAGCASVTPGMDGSYIFLLAGTYQPIMDAIDALTHLTIQWHVLVPTGIGAALGIVGFSKLVDTAIKRIPSLTYYCVLGIVGGSIYGLWPRSFGQTSILISIVCLVVGLGLGYYLAKASAAHETAAVDGSNRPQ